MAPRRTLIALAALLSCCALPAQTASAAPADAVGGDGAPVDVLVSLDWAPTAADVRQLEAAVPVDVQRRFEVVDAVAARVPSQALAALARQDGVVAVERDGGVSLFNASAQQSTGVTKARLDAPGLDGAGLTAAVVDTGIDAGHQELDGGKVKAFATCLSGTCVAAAPADDNGHGTHVSATLAGDGGVAPGASLVGVQVLDRYGGPVTGAKSRMIAGIEWVVAHKDELGIDVMNLSIGIPSDGPLGEGCSDGTDLLSQAAASAVAAGITVVAAAGNSGPSPCSIGTPAASPAVLTVGGIADLSAAGESDGRPVAGFRLASWSSRGPTQDGRVKPDVVAPGVEITSARAGTVNGYRDASGTSGASPFVAGLAVLMLDADPALTPAQVKARMMGTAVDWGPDGTDSEYGAGRLDAYAALRAAGAPIDAPPPAPLEQHHEGSLEAVGEVDEYLLPRVDGSMPVAATLTVPDGSALSGSVDFDLRLRDPSGTVVASATSVPRPLSAPGQPYLPAVNGRQEDLGFIPAVPGRYTLEVVSVTGTGAYSLDVSRPRVAPASTAAPVITGDPRVGATLTASTGDWDSAPGTTFAYEWESCATPDDCDTIEGATGATLTASPAEANRTIRVRVTATDEGGSASVTGAAVGPVGPGEFTMQDAPMVMGPRVVGATLSAHGGTWSPAPAGSAFQWLRCSPDCRPIDAADRSAYTLTSEDLGAVVRVRQRVWTEGYDDAISMSAPGDAVAAGTMQVIAEPSVSGTSIVGATLTAQAGSFAPEPESAGWQWLRCSPDCVEIPGAGASSYLLTAADLGAHVRVRQTARRDGYAAAIATSAAAAAVAPGEMALQAPPAVSGARTVGARLTAHPGTWRPASDGSRWQWLRCAAACEEIAGAREGTYVLSPADLGKIIRAREVVSADGYLEGSALSPPTDPVAAGAFTLQEAPALTGVAAVGGRLTVAPARWAPLAERGSLQWLRCSAETGACTPIPGAVQDSYTPVPADGGASLRVRETVDAEGYLQAEATSPQTARVAAGLRLLGTADRDVLEGGLGTDALFGRGGDDVLRGGPATDRLDAGAGDDRLDGGAGYDRLFGGPGNDVIFARDGARDVVECGPGRDRVVADRRDRIGASCERATLR